MDDRIRRVAVVGTGTMGAQIAIQAACYGYKVSAYDPTEGSFEEAVERLKVFMQLSGRNPLVSMEEWERGVQAVRHWKDLKEALRNADIVIEAVPESLDLKRKVFQKLDDMAPPTAILGTNSSSIPISNIEGATNRPDKCLNIHFYSPATGWNMVDIMGGTMTTAETMQAVKAWLHSIACVPLTVRKEILGFCFNRVWRAIKKETLYLWSGGYVDFKDIDRAWMIFTGMPQGPFGIMDAVGLDVVHDIEMIYHNQSQDPKDHPPVALKKMVERNELGMKTGKGFYTYPDPEYQAIDFLKAPKR